MRTGNTIHVRTAHGNAGRKRAVGQKGYPFYQEGKPRGRHKNRKESVKHKNPNLNDLKLGQRTPDATGANDRREAG
jgi:hypothetical protein